MKKIILICPFFGKLPQEHMNLWLQSCEKNPTIDWIIFTDDETNYNYPKNVRVEYMTFLELKSFFQKKFDFPISLERAYKLCDYKPAYGYIFSDYIKKYDFWGYCDMSDCIFGNIRTFLTDDILEQNDKIGFLGHLTLYKNDIEVNERFKLKSNSSIIYKDIFSNENNFAFDELNEYSINSIYNYNKLNTYRIDQFYFDISPLYYPFVRSCYDKNYKHTYLKKIPTFFKWSDGKLYKCSIVNKSLEMEELLYVHFQKRVMKRAFNEELGQYYIIPNEFVSEFDENDMKKIRKISKYKPYSQFFKLKYKSLKFRIKKFFKK